MTINPPPSPHLLLLAWTTRLYTLWGGWSLHSISLALYFWPPALSLGLSVHPIEVP